MKLVYIVSRFPYPLVKGDKLRAFHQIKSLSETCDICLCALSDEKVSRDQLKALEPYCKEIHMFKLSKLNIVLRLIYHFIFTKKPLQVGYFYQKSIHVKILDVISNFKPDRIYCQLIRTSEYVRQIKSIPKTLDYMDALSSGMQRRTEDSKSFFKPIFRNEARRLKRYEHFVFDDFENSIIISESDRNLIFQYNNEDIKIIPNGVDQEYFKPHSSEKKFDLLFTGNMSYPPNVRTAQYLVQEIMPLIRKKRPETTLLISGANPVAAVKKLAGTKVVVQGWTEDIRKSYSQCKILIAPMIIGSGLQNKLLEAMSMGLPCITSELANKSLGGNDGESILVGHTANEYSELALKLLDNISLSEKIGENGHRFVTSAFNWSVINRHLFKILENNHG